MNFYSKKHIIILVCILILRCLSLPTTHAMLTQGTNLTSLAENEEMTNREYRSIEGVYYRKRNQSGTNIREKTRVEHIKQHFEPSKKIRDVHGVFLKGTDAHTDIVQFVDNIFRQLKQLEINLVTCRIGINYIGLGNIELSGKEYKVMHGYNGNQHTCRIIPAKPQIGYDATGVNKGTQNTDEKLYGYRFIFNHVGSNEIEIQTFHPFGNYKYIGNSFALRKKSDEVFEQLKQLKVDLGHRYPNSIGLNGQDYKAIHSCNGLEHEYNVIPDNLGVQYNSTSIDNPTNDESTLKYGYKLIYYIKKELSEPLFQFSSPFATWSDIEGMHLQLSNLPLYDLPLPKYSPISVSLPLFFFYKELEVSTSKQHFGIVKQPDFFFEAI